jgi:hypothetical protein
MRESMRGVHIVSSECFNAAVDGSILGKVMGMMRGRRTVVGRLLGQRRPVVMESHVLAPDAFRHLVEDRIRARFDMSLTEFAAAFRAGKLDDDPAAYELAVISGASSRRD